MEDQFSSSATTPADSSSDEPFPAEPRMEPMIGQSQEDLTDATTDASTDAGIDAGTDTFQAPLSYADLHPGILEEIFKGVPASQRLVAAAVCHRWRNTFLDTSSCWAGMRLGRNSNCFPSRASLSHCPTDFLPLSYVQEVTFTPAIPAIMRLRPVSDQLKEIPFSWLSLVLRHARKLKRLDLSALMVKDENIADFRAVWSHSDNDSELTTLKLPSGFHITSALLKEIAASHRLIDHLSLSSPCQRITLDECEDPFEGFVNLKSLSLKLGDGSNGWYCHDMADRDSPRTITIGAILNRLSITSLELSDLRFFDRLPWSSSADDEDVWAKTERLVPSLITTPNLIKSLVHLRINSDYTDYIYSDVQYLEYILFHCRHLETLWLEQVYPVDNEYPLLIESSDQISPYLRSVTLGIPSDDEGMWDDEDAHTWYRRLMKLLQICPTPIDIHFLGSGGFSALGVAIFSAQSSRYWWKSISSISFTLTPAPHWSQREWLRLKSLLVHFPNLKSLTLDFDLTSPGIDLAEDAADDPGMFPQPLDSLAFNLSIAHTSAGDLRLIKEILSSFSHVKRLSFDVSAWYNDVELLETCSGEFFHTQFPREAFPACQRMEEYHVSFIPHDGRSLEPYNLVPRTAIASASWVAPDFLPNLKVLTLDCYVRLDSISFETIVLATPQMEHFRSFTSDDRDSSFGLRGLRLTDLPAVCSWKRLRTCHLTLDVSEAELAAPAPETCRKFVQLNDRDIMPHLVQRWKEEFNMLELMDVSCCVVKGHRASGLYPLVFASMCDCGAVHFHIDAESAAAKCLGFLKPDE